MVKADLHLIANTIRNLNLKKISDITLSEGLQEELRQTIAEQFAVFAFSGSEREDFIRNCLEKEDTVWEQYCDYTEKYGG